MSWFEGEPNRDNREVWSALIREWFTATQACRIHPEIRDELAGLGCRWCPGCRWVLPAEEFNSESRCANCQLFDHQQWRRREGSSALASGRKSSALYRVKHPWTDRLARGYKRALRAGLPAVKISEQELLDHWARIGVDPNRSAYSGVSLTAENRSLDHLIPLCDSESPGHVLGNLWPCTQVENTHRKRGRKVIPFRALALLNTKEYA